MTKENKYTCYIPFHNSNLYTSNVKAAISKNGYEIISITNFIFHPWKYHQCRIFNFNWQESVETWWEAAYKKLLIIYIKILRKKIIYTVHNKKPHDLSDYKYAAIMMKFFCNKADAIVGLCSDTRDVVAEISPKDISKIKIIPSPNYIENYKVCDCLNVKAGEKIRFLFFGAIMPYKNIEMLIDIFNSITDINISLDIVGKPISEQYKREIETKIVSKNIFCDFRFIPDAEVASIFAKADIVILPYNKESSLNSGAALLAFSLKRTVIAPRIGTLNDFENDEMFYQYNYSDKDEHKAILEEMINRVIKEERANPEILRNKGNEAYKYVADKYSLEYVSGLYNKLYGSLQQGEKCAI